MHLLNICILLQFTSSFMLDVKVKEDQMQIATETDSLLSIKLYFKLDWENIFNESFTKIVLTI